MKLSASDYAIICSNDAGAAMLGGAFCPVSCHYSDRIPRRTPSSNQVTESFCNTQEKLASMPSPVSAQHPLLHHTWQDEYPILWACKTTHDFAASRRD